MNKIRKFSHGRNAFCWILFLVHFISVQAQDQSKLETCDKGCCCSSDPTPAGVMISHVHQKNEWMISYRYMDMGMSGVLDGTKSVDANSVYTNYLMSPNTMRMDMHMLMGMYGITDRLTTMVMLNYNVNSMTMTMLPTVSMPGMDMGPSGSMPPMKTTGIGDLKLHFLYGLINGNYHQLLVSGGVNIPLGSIQQKGDRSHVMYPNQRLPYMMQLGSGTVDVLPCVNYLYQKNDLTFSSQLSSTIRTAMNQFGYKWGNEAVLNTWFAYNWLGNLSSSVRLEGCVQGKMTGFDPTLYRYNEPSANSLNYGGEKVNTYIGSTYHFKSGFLKNNRLGVEYGIPLYQNVNGLQMKGKQSIYASWSVTF